jgi:hypothetical protein
MKHCKETLALQRAKVTPRWKGGIKNQKLSKETGRCRKQEGVT